MNPTTLYFTPPALALDRKAILNYARTRKDENVERLLELCLQESQALLTPRLCYRIFPIKITRERCDFGDFVLTSSSLAVFLANSSKAAVFAATLGVGLDRLIQKYSLLSPAKALLLQAIGTQQIEALCDAFCLHLASCRERFSPGYADLSLDAQKSIFASLDCQKIGLTLCDSLLMSPKKSVTAIVPLR